MVEPVSNDPIYQRPFRAAVAASVLSGLTTVDVVAHTHGPTPEVIHEWVEDLKAGLFESGGARRSLEHWNR
ncbi:MAG: hypothetical protein GF344_06640 [Chitinivibrionales bacterium]|nr:hypothetical protein [Chitinivibrionales bacterium]MBD3356604.1 hypothetical protein [Chitinivibrionales bacterium]